MLAHKRGYAVLESAGLAFSQWLTKSTIAMSYLTRCGISEKVATEHQLGVYDIRAFSSLLVNFSDQELIDAGLVSIEAQGALPLFPNHLMMPLYDESKQIMGFIAQSIPGQEEMSRPYDTVLNKADERESAYFGKRTVTTGDKETLIVVSSPLEVLGLSTAGCTGVVSPLNGRITEGFLDRMLSSSQGVEFLLPSREDKSTIGKQALEASIALIGEHRPKDIRFSFLPKASRHCNEFILKNPKVDFSDLLKNSRDIPELIFRKLVRPETPLPEEKAFVQQVADELSQLHEEDIKKSYIDQILKWYSDKKPAVSNPKGKTATSSKARKATAKNEQPVETDEPIAIDPTPAQHKDVTAESIDIPEWVNHLIASDKFTEQMARCGRRAPTQEKVSIAIAVIDSGGGRASMRKLSQHIDISKLRIRGFIGGLKALLNFDNVNVLSIEEESETLMIDRRLLKSQFKLSE